MHATHHTNTSWLSRAIGLIEVDYLRSAAAEAYEQARALAQQSGGHYMDQFTYAERATDWRGNNNIAQSMFSQMARERHPNPRWVAQAMTLGWLA